MTSDTFNSVIHSQNLLLKKVCLCVQMRTHRGMMCRRSTLFQLNLVIDLGNCLYYMVLWLGEGQCTHNGHLQRTSLFHMLLLSGKYLVGSTKYIQVRGSTLVKDYTSKFVQILFGEKEARLGSQSPMLMTQFNQYPSSSYFQEHYNCTKCEPWFMKMEYTPHKETLSKCIRPAYHEILEHLWTGLLPQSTTYTYDVRSMHLKFLCNQSRNNNLTLPPSD